MMSVQPKHMDRVVGKQKGRHRVVIKCLISLIGLLILFKFWENVKIIDLNPCAKCYAKNILGNDWQN